MKINQSDYYILIGLTAAGIGKRKEANLMQDEIEKRLKECGFSDSDAYNWASELVYSEGDEPAAAIDGLMSVLGLKVDTE